MRGIKLKVVLVFHDVNRYPRIDRLKFVIGEDRFRNTLRDKVLAVTLRLDMRLFLNIPLTDKTAERLTDPTRLLATQLYSPA